MADKFLHILWNAEHFSMFVENNYLLSFEYTGFRIWDRGREVSAKCQEVLETSQKLFHYIRNTVFYLHDQQGLLNDPHVKASLVKL